YLLTHHEHRLIYHLTIRRYLSRLDNNKVIYFIFYFALYFVSFLIKIFIAYCLHTYSSRCDVFSIRDFFINFFLILFSLFSFLTLRCSFHFLFFTFIRIILIC